MFRKAHVLGLGLLDNLNVSCVALGGIPSLLLSPQVLEVGGGGCPTLEDGDAFISGRVESGTVARIELERNPFIETFVIKIVPFLDPALLLVGPS
jgi:hypothetical protein